MRLMSDLFLQSMTLKEAIKSSLVILKQVMEEKLNATNIEVTVTPVRDCGLRSRSLRRLWSLLPRCKSCWLRSECLGSVLRFKRPGEKAARSLSGEKGALRF